jgi:hypothetical protein
MTRQTPETPPTVAMQVLTLSVIFALGLGGGWLLWGRDQPQGSASSQPAGKGVKRKIELGKPDATGGKTSAAVPSAPSATLDAIFRALTIVNPDARLAACLEALGGMKPEDAPAVRQKLKDGFLPNKDFNPERDAFYRCWGEIDPAGVIAFAKTQPDPKAQGWVLKLMIEGWARKDYAAAAKWLDGWPEAPDWEGVCMGLIRGIASHDPWMASQTAVASIPEGTGGLRETAVVYLAAAMERRGGPAEVKRWFESLPDSTLSERKFKEKAMHQAALHLEHTAPEELRPWLEAQPPKLWRAPAAYATAAKNLAQTDPAAALNWLAALPQRPVPLKIGAGKEIYRTWSGENPEAAMAWIKTVVDQNFLIEIGVLQPAAGMKPPEGRK